MTILISQCADRLLYQGLPDKSKVGRMVLRMARACSIQLIILTVYFDYECLARTIAKALWMAILVVPEYFPLYTLPPDL